MDTKLKRYQELDALRGIAALFVVLFHFTLNRPEAEYGLKLGVTGVDLFFIISGFVIFMSLTNINSSKEFIVNRVSRLYPTYWASVTFAFILIIVSSKFQLNHLSIVQYLGNLTMFQYYLKIPDIDGPYWTMIIEMIFYIGILILFHFKLTKFLNPICLSLIIITVFLTSFYFNNIFVKRLLAYIPLLQFLPLFFAGITFYRIYTSQTFLKKNYFFIALCFVCQALLYNYSEKTKLYISQIEYTLMLSLYFLLFTLFCNKKLKFIITKTSLFLGKISFALYLIHQKIAVIFIIPFLVNYLNVNFWVAAILITLPIIIGLATIITYYIEIPLSKKLKHKLGKICGVRLNPTQNN